MLSAGRSKAGAVTYKECVDYLLSDQNFLYIKDIDIQNVIEKLKRMKYKGQYSKYKNAFLQYCQFANITVSNQQKLELKLSTLDKKKKYRSLPERRLSDIEKKINHTKDDKLRMSFQTLLVTALRITELSNINKDNCTINDDSIVFEVDTKGQRKALVTIFKKDNPILYENLVSLINKTKSSKVFYSAKYIQSKAKEKGFSCHDLRRARAKLIYREYKNLNEVMEKLNHKNKQTSKIYVNSKILIDE